MKRTLTLVLALGYLFAVTPGHSEKVRHVPLKESICQSDIIVVGSLHRVKERAYTLTYNNDYPIPMHFDWGQISPVRPKEFKPLKDDPWRTTSGLVDVVFVSSAKNFASDNGEWIWLLHRENLFGRYFILKRMATSEEEDLKKKIRDTRCDKA